MQKILIFLLFLTTSCLVSAQEARFKNENPVSESLPLRFSADVGYALRPTNSSIYFLPAILDHTYEDMKEGVCYSLNLMYELNAQSGLSVLARQGFYRVQADFSANFQDGENINGFFENQVHLSFLGAGYNYFKYLRKQKDQVSLSVYAGYVQYREKAFILSGLARINANAPAVLAQFNYAFGLSKHWALNFSAGYQYSFSSSIEYDDGIVNLALNDPGLSFSLEQINLACGLSIKLY